MWHCGTSVALCSCVGWQPRGQRHPTHAVRRCFFCSFKDLAPIAPRARGLKRYRGMKPSRSRSRSPAFVALALSALGSSCGPSLGQPGGDLAGDPRRSPPSPDGQRWGAATIQHDSHSSALVGASLRAADSRATYYLAGVKARATPGAKGSGASSSVQQTRTGPTRSTGRTQNTDSLLLVVEDGGPLVVLSHEVDLGWGRGPILADVQPGDVLARAWQAVRAESLSAGQRRLLSSEVTLVTDEGVACQTRLGSPWVLRRVIPTQEIRAEWEDGEYDRDLVARMIWNLGRGSELLVAPALDPGDACKEALWAYPVGETPPRYASGRNPRTRSPEVMRQSELALDAFRGLKSYRSIQRAYLHDERRQDDPDGLFGASWEHHGGSSAVPLFFETPGGHSFVGWHAQVGVGCDDFHASLWAVFRFADQGPQLIATGTTDEPPLTLLDLDRNGRFLALNYDGLFPYGRRSALRRTEVPFLDYPCEPAGTDGTA